MIKPLQFAKKIGISPPFRQKDGGQEKRRAGPRKRGGGSRTSPNARQDSSVMGLQINKC